MFENTISKSTKDMKLDLILHNSKVESFLVRILSCFFDLQDAHFLKIIIKNIKHLFVQ